MYNKLRLHARYYKNWLELLASAFRAELAQYCAVVITNDSLRRLGKRR